MPTEHTTLTDPELHEPKGASTAASGTHYIADGSGSGTWDKDPFGFIYFKDLVTPYVLTYPSVYTKIAPTTTAPGVSYKVTEGTNARLTYTGGGQTMDIICNISCDQSSGGSRDLEFCIYKNGAEVPGSCGVVTTTSGEKHFLSIQAAATLATNDYLECYCKNAGASGDVSVYTFSLFLDPH